MIDSTKHFHTESIPCTGQTGKATGTAANAIAWAAGRTKASYFRAQYKRLAARRGRKRAIVAVAHAQLQVIHHLLKGSTYQDLGPNHFDKRAGDRLKHNLVARLNHLGYTVTLQEKEVA